MTYLIHVAFFGAAAVMFLWLRDARIFYRTGCSGYRQAAYKGIAYSALATLGVACAVYMLEILGLGLILGALYLQGRIRREKVWSTEGTVQRFFGSVAVTMANKK